MKYLKTYKIFEAVQDFSWLSDLFQSLKDDGFRVIIQDINSYKLDFSKSDVMSACQLRYAGPNRSDDWTDANQLKILNVKVEKREILSDGSGLSLKPFNIDEIKETLRFAESYVKDEGIGIEYIFTAAAPNYLYYKSVGSLPDNQIIDSIQFAFRKPDPIK